MVNRPALVRPPRDPFWGRLTGHGLTLRKNRLQYMHDCMLQYGEFIEFRIGRKLRTLMINNPQGIEWVMVKNAKNYSKNTPGYRAVSKITGDAVFTDSGERWRDARRLMQPFFSSHNMPNYAQIIAKSCQKLKNDIDQSIQGQQTSTLNISSMMTELTLRIIGECIFNFDLGVYATEIGQQLTTLIDIGNSGINDISPLPTLQKIKNARDSRAAHGELDKVIVQLIEKSNSDIITSLRRSPFHNGHRYMIDQVKTLAFAGHETSASVLSWAFYFLARENHWRGVVEREVRGEVSPDGTISLEVLPRLPQLKMLLQETMRLRPPAWSFGRLAMGPDTIFGEKIYPGDTITISPFLMHHNPRLYSDPLQFNPLRFAPEQRAKKPKAAYIPFGLGPRLCLGAELAMVEMMMILATVLKDFNIRPLESTIEMCPSISLRPLEAISLSLAAK